MVTLLRLELLEPSTALRLERRSLASEDAVVRSALVVVAIGSVLLAPQVVPVEQEPRHRPVFQNAWVRALDVRFDVGAASLFHRHALPNIAVRIVGGVTRADPIGGEGTSVETPTGKVTYYSAAPPYVHRVVNVGDGPVHIIDVELLGQQPVPNVGSTDAAAGHQVEVENERVRVSRVRLGHGESMAAHTHRRGWLDVNVSGGTPGGVAWHEAAHTAVSEGGANGLEWIEIEPR